MRPAGAQGTRRGIRVRRRSKAPSTASAHAAGSKPAESRKARGLFGVACLCVLGLTAFLGSSAPTVGAAESFPGQGFLPDNRAWEMVSPPDKNGSHVMITTLHTRAAADGSAVGFASLGGFADVRGSGVDFEYLADREPAAGTNGWITHSITPGLQDSQTFGGLLQSGLAFSPMYESEFSADLDTGILHTYSPLTAEDATVLDRSNLYLRNDLRTPGQGSYQLLNSCILCAAAEPAQPLAPYFGITGALAEANSGTFTVPPFSHILFESRDNLATGPLGVSQTPTGSTPKLYEWTEGTPRLVGILPDNSVAQPAQAGQGASAISYTRRVLSRDGSRIDFTSPTSGNAQSLYQRINNASTVRLNNVEGITPAPTAKAATFQTASVDGTRVFFSTAQPLTPSGKVNGTSTHLYRWDANPNNEAQLVTVLADGGTFTLAFDAQTTSPIPFDASAQEVEATLNALPAIGGAGASVTVGRNSGNSSTETRYEVVFTGSLAASDVSQLVPDSSSLTIGGSPGGTAEGVTLAVGGGHLTQIDIDRNLVDGNTLSGVAGASEDGNTVYFFENGRLLPNLPSPTGSASIGIYQWHDDATSTGAVSFVGYVPSTDVGLNTSRFWNLKRPDSRVTPSGAHFLFSATSGVGLTGYNHTVSGCGGQACREFYLYSASNASLVCVSCNPSGADATAAASIVAWAPDLGSGGTSPTSHLNRVVSDDGRYVFFSTGERLVPEDTMAMLSTPMSTTHLSVACICCQVGKATQIPTYWKATLTDLTCL